jgi:hypothetical protein
MRLHGGRERRTDGQQHQHNNSYQYFAHSLISPFTEGVTLCTQTRILPLYGSTILA